MGYLTMKKLITCPKCGQLGYGPYLKKVGVKQRYWYIAHKFKDENGKTRIKWCYVSNLELPRAQIEEAKEDLLEVFKDFQIYVEGKASNGKYRALYQVIPREDRQIITVKELRDYVKNLAVKYPDEQFRLERKGKYYVLTKRVKLPNSEERKKLQELHDKMLTISKDIGALESQIKLLMELKKQIEERLREFEEKGVITLIKHLIFRKELLEAKARKMVYEKKLMELENEIKRKNQELDKVKREIFETEELIGRVEKGIEIWFDLKEQKVYVPKFYVEKLPKLTNYLLMVTLGALGLTTTRYLKTCGKVDSKVN